VHKHGWQTSEFWITTLVSIPAFLVSAGVVPSSDSNMISDNISKIMAGLVAAATLWKYIHSRMHVKSALYENAIVPKVSTVLLLLFLVQPSAAQTRPTCLFGNNNNSQILSQIASQNAEIMLQNQQIIVMLLAMKAQPQQQPQIVVQPAPQPQPQLIVLGGPQQQIPLGGQPYQQIPLGGPPLQQIPLGGPPAQQIPLGGPPQQQIPIGQPPLQQIPLGPQAAPVSPQVTPSAPAPQATPRQVIPLGPPPATGPTGMQRFTRTYAWQPALWPSSSSGDSIWEPAQR
jgi:hypothetical protein